MSYTNIDSILPSTSLLSLRGAAVLVLPAAALLLGGCATPAEPDDDNSYSEEATGEDAAAINGSIVFPDSSCTAAEKAKILLVAADAVDILFNQAAALNACFADSFMSADLGVSPEQILHRLREDMPTEMFCKDPSFCGADACAPVDVSFERIFWSKPTLATAPVESLSSVMLHEVAHNKGWIHFGGRETMYSPTVQIMWCAQFDDPTGTRRSDIPHETELGQVGSDGGAPFLVGCGSSNGVQSFMIGINAGIGTFVRKLGARCKTPGSSGDGWDTPMTGSGAGVTTNVSVLCGSDSVVTGIKGRSGNVVDSMKVLCSDIDDVRAGLTTTATINIGGGAGGLDFERRCPPGMAVARIIGRSGDAIEQMRLVCHEVDEPARSGYYISSSNTVGSTTGFHDRQYCAGFGALVGLYGQSGVLVDRLGGVCEPLLPDAAGNLQRDGAHEHVTAAYGGFGGTTFDDECPAGFALVGFNARAGTLVDRVQGICGRISKWKAGVTLAASDKQTLPARGGNGGSAVTRECPQGQFLAGFETWSDDNEPSGILRGLRPMCRRLEPMN